MFKSPWNSQSATLNTTIIFNIVILILSIGILIFLVCYSNQKSTNDIGSHSRISLKGARSTIPNEPFPTELKNYTVDSSDTTGIYTDWNTSSTSLGQICTLITMGLQYAYHHPKTKDSDLCIQIAEDFMVKYHDRLMDVGIEPKQPPWGTHWYEFSVSSTAMLAYYLLLPKPKLSTFASDLILTIIDNPIQSLGYNRAGVNAVYLTGPYLLAKYMNDDLVDVLDSFKYKYTFNYISKPIRRDKDADGMHIDMTFLFYSGVVAYYYLETLDSYITNYYYKLDSEITPTLIDTWKQVLPILRHKTIDVAALGVTGRMNTLEIPIEPTSPYGIKVIPFQRYLRYFTKDYQFSVRGQVPWLCYYESDPTNYSQAMYWVQYRTVHTKNSSKSLKFPDAGFICDSSITDLIEIKTTANRLGFKPTDAESFVLAYGRYGILWQKYIISKFGSQQVTELIVVDSILNVITIDVIIETTSETTVFYSSLDEVSIEEYRTNLTPLPVDSNTHYKTTFDLEKGTVKTIIVSDSTELLPLTLEDGISISADDTYAFLLINNNPKILLPKSPISESNSLTVDGLIYTFNETLNQYAVSG